MILLAKGIVGSLRKKKPSRTHPEILPSKMREAREAYIWLRGAGAFGGD